METYGAQLAKERAEIGATRTTELFFEEIEVDEDVRYCIFVYLLDGSIREKVLYPCGIVSHEPSPSPALFPQGSRRRLTMRDCAINAVAARYASSLYGSLICSESTTVVSQLTSS